MFDHLSTADLQHLNERIVRQFGGTTTADSTELDESLELLTEAVRNADHKYLAYVATDYFLRLATAKLFTSGNAQTALLAARTFVQLNGGRFHKKLKAVESAGRRIPATGNGRAIFVELTKEAGNQELTAEDAREWFRRNVT